MSISKSDVERVAVLSRLLFTQDELLKLRDEMQNVVDYFQQLDQVDTTDIAPMAHPIDVENVFCDDSPQPSLPRELALRNAPKADAECYRVPAVLGE